MSSLVEGQVGDTANFCAAGIPSPQPALFSPQLSDSSLMSGRLKRNRREGLGEKQWQSLEERGSAPLRPPKLTRWVLHLMGMHPTPRPHIPPLPLESPTLMPRSRSKTYESSCKETEEVATGRQGPPSPSVSFGVQEEVFEEQDPSPSPIISAGHSLGVGAGGRLVPVLWQMW